MNKHLMEKYFFIRFISFKFEILNALIIMFSSSLSIHTCAVVEVFIDLSPEKFWTPGICGDVVPLMVCLVLEAR